ncbi:hypothetical protein BJ742DRAFT_799358 [Cladochytrium replicatum]|nr:hypothetical protein BJ742DRAFT_799358 [Cladochytrium replicatum]
MSETATIHPAAVDAPQSSPAVPTTTTTTSQSTLSPQSPDTSADNSILSIPAIVVVSLVAGFILGASVCILLTCHRRRRRRRRQFFKSRVGRSDSIHTTEGSDAATTLDRPNVSTRSLLRQLRGNAGRAAPTSAAAAVLVPIPTSPIQQSPSYSESTTQDLSTPPVDYNHNGAEEEHRSYIPPPAVMIPGLVLEEQMDLVHSLSNSRRSLPPSPLSSDHEVPASEPFKAPTRPRTVSYPSVSPRSLRRSAPVPLVVDKNALRSALSASEPSTGHTFFSSPGRGRAHSAGVVEVLRDSPENYGAPVNDLVEGSPGTVVFISELE